MNYCQQLSDVDKEMFTVPAASTRGHSSHTQRETVFSLFLLHPHFILVHTVEQKRSSMLCLQGALSAPARALQVLSEPGGQRLSQSVQQTEKLHVMLTVVVCEIGTSLSAHICVLSAFTFAQTFCSTPVQSLTPETFRVVIYESLGVVEDRSDTQKPLDSLHHHGRVGTQQSPIHNVQLRGLVELEPALEVGGVDPGVKAASLKG